MREKDRGGAEEEGVGGMVDAASPSVSRAEEEGGGGGTETASPSVS